jgi:geranylgeranyl diphosphate synthase type II
MKAIDRIETALEAAVQRTFASNGPPQLALAIRHAVFPGGARVRPHLSIAVSEACGGDEPGIADAAAAAIELMHCASLVHDDLPCFDNAAIRRGQPSVHGRFGAPLALLAGDALIVLAFEILSEAAAHRPDRLVPLITTLARGVGAPYGICAGQAWESEIDPPAETYRCAKTGALFVAATVSGALAAGGDPTPWRAVGYRLGEAYQVADDLLDMVTAAAESDKPVGQDSALGRPNAVLQLGVSGAVRRLEELVAAAMEAIPACRGERELRELVRAQAMRLAPKNLMHRVA